MDLTRRGPPKEPVHKKASISVTTALVSAFLEWALMFMIFIDAIFAYLITNFARYCQLPIPCLLCSRLDHHVLGHDKCYGDLICHKHKFKISSLVLCQLHNNNEGAEHGAPVVEDPHLLPHVEYTKIKVTSDSGSESSLVQSDHYNDDDDISKPSELVSFSEAVRSPGINGTTQYNESKGTNTTNASELEKEEAQVECLEASNVESDPSELPKNKVNKEREDNETQIDPEPNTTTSQIPEPFDLGDAYKLAVSTRGSSSRQLSGKFLEQQKSMAESTKASEDLKLLLSQLSASRSVELLSLRDNTSPRISLERNESNLSLDGSIICEIEGESAVDRIKRQAEHDKKIISRLYKELEEEINASSIAANQAMAMITRLQEEKASLHMEALQCLRMMEEQAEYDDEALRRANDLIAEKDKLIQDLEYELESFRR